MSIAERISKLSEFSGLVTLCATCAAVALVATGAVTVMTCTHKNHHPPDLRDGQTYVPRTIDMVGVYCPCGYNVLSTTPAAGVR